jgi:hypothetical protein
LPTEGPIMTEIAIYESAIRFIYLQSDQPIAVILNGGSAETVRPLIDQNKSFPGVFVRTDSIYSLELQNLSIRPAKIWMALVG